MLQSNQSFLSARSTGNTYYFQLHSFQVSYATSHFLPKATAEITINMATPNKGTADKIVGMIPSTTLICLQQTVHLSDFETGGSTATTCRSTEEKRQKFLF